jgi:hypothetical protein
MTAIAQMPLGQIVSLSKISTDDKASKIIDVITARLSIRGVETTYQSIANDLFTLRLEILNKITIDDAQKLPLSINKTHPNESDKLIADILPIYLHIMQKMLQQPLQQIGTISLHDFHVATALMPREQGLYIEQFVEDSLKVDFALIAFDCFQFSTLPPSVFFDLYQLLRLSFERYAARAAFFKIWDTEDFETESQMLRSIKILRARMNADAHIWAFKAQNIEQAKTYFENIA